MPGLQVIPEKVRQLLLSFRSLSFRSPVAAVFLYHTVEETASPWTKGHRYVTPFPAFKKQIDFLRQHFKIVHSSALVETLSQGRLTEPIAAIHFDDGFRTYYDTVVPYLRTLQIPSTLFPIHDIFYGAIPPRNKLAYLLNSGYQETFIQSLPTLQNFKGSASDLLSYIKFRMDDRIEARIHDLFNEVIAKNNVQSPFITVSELQELAKEPLVELGSHTLSHSMLSKLDPARQRQEIVEGHQKLASLAGRSLPFFAYPFGGQGHYTPESEKIVSEMPGVTAFTTYGGLNTAYSKTDIRRITLASHTPSAVKLAILSAMA